MFVEDHYSNDMELNIEVQRVDEPMYKAVDYMKASWIVVVVVVDMDLMEEVVVDVHFVLVQSLKYEFISIELRICF